MKPLINIMFLEALAHRSENFKVNKCILEKFNLDSLDSSIDYLPLFGIPPRLLIFSSSFLYAPLDSVS